MKNIVISLIKLYQKTLSPVFVSLFGNGCRFNPTCSEYSKEAISKFGVLEGGALSIKRIGRCHPFSKGYFDPVPEARR